MFGNQLITFGGPRLYGKWLLSKMTIYCYMCFFHVLFTLYAPVDVFITVVNIYILNGKTPYVCDRVQ